ncbi:phage virion morphogenesis protein [Agrobacterium vitis]|uniref:phage virion morphogenesis protein n=1 Tax=Agrobacterium vitis TaxID=373 RepID=UPI0012E6F03A|nr:phage virion morphogenesis protein [Agrobacterium vitis]MVA40667.1 phage virion morphogenesis protein [Agrobacterium vitis]NSX96944.1 phage virion morphogenesis protein [Agrobacterium vitis]NSZ28083.1 phage virion morphogenesis protein [Agrobacterium vitis]UJL77997.1 phage virion morphogenesis protein [Agrobacterium vitis]UJL83207.1 phage virion morphogenesis protein [Agrobacterium vitis]
MTGISYKATIDDADMREKLAELIGKMQRPAGFYKNVGEHLLNSVKDNFENESAPDGSRWKTLSQATRDQREKKYGHAPTAILRASGDLANSINMQASDTDVRIGSSLIYAAIHQFGGDAGRGNKVNIPARPYLGLSAADEDEVVAIAEEWLAVE